MRVNKTIQYYELTNYPNIYKKCYWGRFTYGPNSNIKYQVINRDLFITDFDIKGSYNNTPKWVREQCDPNISTENGYSPFDHVEFYKNNKNEHVVITSPYGVEDGEKHHYLRDNGWVEIMPMYTTDARTYMKTFKPRKPKGKQNN